MDEGAVSSASVSAGGRESARLDVLPAAIDRRRRFGEAFKDRHTRRFYACRGPTLAGRTTGGAARA